MITLITSKTLQLGIIQINHVKQAFCYDKSLQICDYCQPLSDIFNAKNKMFAEHDGNVFLINRRTQFAEVNVWNW